MLLTVAFVIIVVVVMTLVVVVAPKGTDLKVFLIVFTAMGAIASGILVLILIAWVCGRCAQGLRNEWVM
jgi:hypothetical protein